MSSPPLAVEGSLELSVRVEEGRFAALSVINRRPLSIASAFTGQEAQAAVSLCARLFSICRMAQGLASAQAMEKAGGFVLPAAHAHARELMILAETVLEHAGRSLLVWPDFVDQPVQLLDLKALRRALSDFHLALYPDGDWMRPGGGRLNPDQPQLTRRLAEAAEVVAKAVFAGEAPSDLSSWQHWVEQGKTTGALMARSIQSRGWADFGASLVKPLPPIAEPVLDERLRYDEGSFTAAPTWDGVPQVTGPFARHAAHPLVAALGQGLMARLAARLVELSAALKRMQRLVHDITADAGRTFLNASGAGLGVVEAARGRLVHRVELEQGRVTRYQILAPTEWNFHPQGALAQGLLGHVAGDAPDLLVRHLVAALDPCVACKIEVA